MPTLEEYTNEIASLWDTHMLTNMGAKHHQLEEELEKYLGVDDIALFVNGHNALECVIEAMGLKGKVITTPYSFASTTHAIVRKGLTPVFADIKPDDYTLDPEKIEELIDEDTCAIMPVHVYGNLCDVDAIQEIADRHGIKVIYDAAHAFGVKKDGVSSATFGDASMFSFHATKVFNTIEGGALCFKDEALAQRIRDLKNFGIQGPEDVEYIGGNAKMNEFCAAMGLCNLRHLDGEIAKRRHVSDLYDARLGGVPGIQLNPVQPGVERNYAYYPVVFDGYKYDRDEVFDRLNKQGIVARKYFYPITNSFACYRGRPGFDPAATPVAAHIADCVLTLPLYAGLSTEDVDRICDIILG